MCSLWASGLPLFLPGNTSHRRALENPLGAVVDLGGQPCGISSAGFQEKKKTVQITLCFMMVCRVLAAFLAK